MVDCKTNDLFMFLCQDGKRTKKVLYPIIEKHTDNHCIFITDKYSTYLRLQEELREKNDKNRMLHFNVNHSKNFVDPVTGANTQKIEAIWRPLKVAMRVGGPNFTKEIDLRIAEYWWRWNCRRRGVDPFEDLLHIFRWYHKEELGPPIITPDLLNCDNNDSMDDFRSTSQRHTSGLTEEEKTWFM